MQLSTCVMIPLVYQHVDTPHIHRKRVDDVTLVHSYKIWAPTSGPTVHGIVHPIWDYCVRNTMIILVWLSSLVLPSCTKVTHNGKHGQRNVQHTFHWIIVRRSTIIINITKYQLIFILNKSLGRTKCNCLHFQNTNTTQQVLYGLKKNCNKIPLVQKYLQGPHLLQKINYFFSGTILKLLYKIHNGAQKIGSSTTHQCAVMNLVINYIVFGLVGKRQRCEHELVSRCGSRLCAYFAMLPRVPSQNFLNAKLLARTCSDFVLERACWMLQSCHVLPILNFCTSQT